jgi:hypothetical protein
LAHYSKKVNATSFVALVIWMHQVSAIVAKVNFLVGVTDRTPDTTVFLSLLSIAASSFSSLGHVQRVLAHKQASKQFSGWALVQKDIEHRH